MAQNTDTQVRANCFGSRLVVDVVGGGVHPFFLRVMVGTGIHTQPSASLHTPPVYIDYIIILSYRLRRVSVLRPAPSSCRNSKTARNDSDQLGLDRGVRYNHVSQPRGVRYNHWVQPRAVTTRVVIRGRPATSRTLLEGQFDFHVSQLEDGPQPHAARARRVSVLRPAPSSCRNSMTPPARARSLFPSS